MGRLKKIIETQIPGVYVRSVEVGSSIEEDEINGFLMNVNDQVKYVCDKLAGDEKLSNGFHAVGFSQGGQFMRALQQRCPTANIQNLISVGGQHQGVYGLPQCIGANVTLCNLTREMLNLGAYIPFVQDRLVPAEYWHDPLNEQEYLQKCVFLPDINNALPQKNSTYKARLQKLKNFVMVKFLDDTVVQPRESEWFGFYDAGSGTKTHTLQQSKLYQEDWLGLKQMDMQKKLHFLASPGNHLQFTQKWFNDNIIPFLKM